MASIKRLVPGQTVWDIKKIKQGFGIKKDTAYPVKILEVHADYVVAKWYCEPPCKFYEGSIKKWRVTKPDGVH